MTEYEMIERKLQRALEVDPSDGALSWLDERMSRLIAQPDAPATTARSRRMGVLLRPLPLLAAFLLLTGGVAGALGLLERVATGSGAGYRVAWDQAQVLGLAQTDAGYTITLERAYADINQVVVFLNVDGPLTAEPGSLVDLGIALIDSNGDQPVEVGFGGVEADLAAVVRAWDSQVEQAGTYVLEVGSIQVIPAGPSGELPAAIDGAWRFEFELPEPVGTAIQPGVDATVGNATVTLADVRFAPSMIRGVMYLTLDGAPAPVWAAHIESVRHDGELVSTDTDANFYATPIRGSGATGVDFRTGFGAEAPSGSWEITISEIQFPELAASEAASEDEPDAALPGPWTLTFTVP